MTEDRSKGELRTILARLGVVRGDTLYVAVDMARIPTPPLTPPLDATAVKAYRERACALLYEALRDRIGSEGTVVVGTFTYSCARGGKAFVLEETPSEIGPFTDWVRRHPQARRSLHPIFSVAGIGPKAGILLDGVGRAAFGAASPFGRFSGVGLKFLNLGVPLSATLTYVHHLEQIYGAANRYNKLVHTPVFKDGHEVPGPFLAYMKWLKVDCAVTLERLEQCLRHSGALVESPWCGHPNHCVDVRAVEDAGLRMLSENPFTFTERPFDVFADDVREIAIDRP